jgi:DNA ligase-associated metallophosphoesterase
VEKITKERVIFNSEFAGVSLGLLHERALWIESLGALLIADLHFGKAAHFRKSGLPIPELVHDYDLIRLKRLHAEFRPAHTYFMGDLFHSHLNHQWTYLNEFLAEIDCTQFHLIKGNHDVLGAEAYRQSILKIHEEPFLLDRFILSHEPMKTVPAGLLNICGHIHPGVRLAGRAKQAVTLSCFFQSESRLLLPAFGNFTGLATIRPKSQDRVWVIVNEKIIPVLSGTSIG